MLTVLFNLIMGIGLWYTLTRTAVKDSPTLTAVVAFPALLLWTWALSNFLFAILLATAGAALLFVGTLKKARS